MNSKSHKQVTGLALSLLPNEALSKLDNNIQNNIKNSNDLTDKMRDLELVNVESGRDDPHVDSVGKDRWHYAQESMNFTAFNHFIDIKKGAGYFDDFDGYSYKKGSGSVEEYEKVTEEDSNAWYTDLIGWITGFKVDEGVNWYFNDEYVHAPGHPWYRNCSPNLEKYSFPKEKGVFSDTLSELRARFPLAESTGGENRGVPYSIFMPVDNLGRHWYSYFVGGYGQVSNSWEAIGRVMHAIQDASVPQHAAGYLGNWHSKYENDLDANISNWIGDSNFINGTKILFNSWNRIDTSPPHSLSLADMYRTPAKNWRTDLLITWIALHAYNEYVKTYNNFRNGYILNISSMRDLAMLAAAMSTLILMKALEAVSIIQVPYSLRDMANMVNYQTMPISINDLALKFGLNTPISMNNLRKHIYKEVG